MSMQNKNNWLTYAIPLALLNGALYFCVAVSGGTNLQRLLHFAQVTPIYYIAIGASLCYGMFAFKTLESLTLKPTTLLTWILAITSPIAASAFLTAGIEGATLLHWQHPALIITTGAILFFMRAINYIDGSVKLPARLAETKSTWVNAFKSKDYKALFCVSLTIYTTIGYSLCSTDPIFGAILKIFAWLHVPYNQQSIIFAYVLTAIGTCAGLPMILYWTQRGLNQMTNSGKVDSHGINRDPTDMYTFFGFLAATPVMIGTLGAATSMHVQVFGQLGFPAEVIRVSTSTVFALCAGIPGLATLFRSTKFLSVFKKPPQPVAADDFTA